MSRTAWRRGTLAAIAALALAALVMRDVPARWLVLEDPPGTADAAVVLAGDPDYERTVTASALVRSGQARLLVLTGGEPGPGDSALSLRARALEAGVPAGLIRWESVSRSTAGAVKALRPLLAREGVHTVLLVTSPYHQRRAYLTARRGWPGIAIRNRPASPSRWKPEGWWRDAASRRVVLTEYAKLFYYGARGWV